MSKRIALEIIVDHKFSGHHIVLDPGSAVTLRYVEWQDPPQPQPQTSTKTAEVMADPNANRAVFMAYAKRYEADFIATTGLDVELSPMKMIAMWINATNRAADFMAFVRSLEPKLAQDAVEGVVSLDSGAESLARLKATTPPS